MDWDEAQKEKEALMKQVVEGLDDSCKKLLVWLLAEEKRNRARARWHYKKPIREKLLSLGGES